MKILVSDTSVLIDLERGSFLDSCFKLPFEFVVPDLLYKRELAGFGGPKLVKLGLRVEELGGDEVTIAQTVRTACPRRGQRIGEGIGQGKLGVRTLLTGDGELRALAKAGKVPFFGVLWVLDQLFEGAVMEAAAIASGLEAIAAHPRCRLPSAEIQARLERFRSGKALA